MTAEKKNKFNPKLGSAFQNDKFGEGSIILTLDADGLKELTQNARVGAAILFRYNKVSTQGNKHYFGEILPPYDGPKAAVHPTKTTVLD